MSHFKIKPREGVIVRDPQTRETLKKEGELKPRSSFWLRRLKDNDVELVAEDAPASAKKSERK